MSDVPFVRELSFRYGRLERVSPTIRRIVAPNPSRFTFHGTGVYVVGSGEVAVIDPGPALPAHIHALAAGLQGETVRAILVTHTHLDHSPGARLLQELTGAPTYGFGPHGGSRAADAVEEGADFDFDPDRRLADGDEVTGPGWRFRAVHTPGHTSNHLCFDYEEENALFSGDHVMGWSTTVISPPDGDMAAYIASLQRLEGMDHAVYWPTHGPPIEQPQAFVRSLVGHRREREQQILACLRQGIDRIGDMTPVMYADIPEAMHPAAARSVLSHLIQLVAEGRVRTEDGGPATLEARYALD